MKILVMFIMIYNTTYSQQVTWQRYYDVNNSPDSGLDVLQTFDGGYAFCGYGGGSLLLMKVNNLGIPEWQRVIPDSNSRYRAYSMQQTNDSGFIITGDVRNDSMLLLKTDKNGIQEWHKTFTNPNGLSRGYSIKITNDNGYIMCGDIFYFSPPGIKAYVVKTDSAGNLQWSMEYDSLFSSDIIQTSDNNYYFVGISSLTKINSVGYLLWTKYIGDGSSKLIIYSDSILFICGTQTISYSYMKLSKVDTSGIVIWQNIYNENSNCANLCMNKNRDIAMIGTAFSDSINPVVNVSIVIVDHKGKLLYSSRINSTTNVNGEAYSIKNTFDNGFIISGITEYGGTSFRTNLLGIKTDSLGKTSNIVNIENNEVSISKDFVLFQNYPNPFNPITTIIYEIPENNFVTLKVFDISGREVKTLVNEFKQSGSYQVRFNGINLSSGVYYFAITSGDFKQVRKMILIK
ncbi:MAG TPA: T9SS type A sorting domain-containing protein [Ignavibacteria bacterium]|nr:T9SS type A sorting domain-containing protein [Ignavibacteria bacterium]